MKNVYKLNLVRVRKYSSSFESSTPAFPPEMPLLVEIALVQRCSTGCSAPDSRGAGGETGASESGVGTRTVFTW